MQADYLVWQTINRGHCSFKTRTGSLTFCRNKYNITGLCNRQSCPLANSKYATIVEEDGYCYLYIKTAERAHTPNRWWEKIRLSRNLMKAMGQLDKHLMYWPKYIRNKSKTRLTKLHQYLIRLRRIANDKNRPVITPLLKKREKLEARREEKAHIASNLQDAIKTELLDRLRTGTYGDLYQGIIATPVGSKNPALMALQGEEQVREEDLDEEFDEDEEEEEEGNTFMEAYDFDEDEDEIDDMEDMEVEMEMETEREHGQRVKEHVRNTTTSRTNSTSLSNLKGIGKKRSLQEIELSEDDEDDDDDDDDMMGLDDDGMDGLDTNEFEDIDGSDYDIDEEEERKTVPKGKGKASTSVSIKGKKASPTGKVGVVTKLDKSSGKSSKEDEPIRKRMKQTDDIPDVFFKSSTKSVGLDSNKAKSGQASSTQSPGSFADKVKQRQTQKKHVKLQIENDD